MSFEIAYLCTFYFNITDPNDKKSFEHSNQVRKLIFEGERERKSAGSLGMLGFGVCFLWKTKGLCIPKYPEYEEDANYINPLYK